MDLPGFSSNCGAQKDADATGKTHNKNLSLSKSPRYQMSLGEENFQWFSPWWVSFLWIIKIFICGEVNWIPWFPQQGETIEALSQK